jgi:hypothetical protein
MPMIDVYATGGTFTDKHQLAQDLALAVMRWESGARSPKARFSTGPGTAQPFPSPS